MELTQMKPGPPIGFYKILGNIGVPLLGGISLFIVALQCWRAADGFQCFLLAPVGLGIGVIGLSYYKHRRALSQLEGKIDDSVLAGLYVTGTGMAFFGYLICEMALVFSVHRH
jgi:hypothetical protein